jgi:hypothetical protein
LSGGKTSHPGNWSSWAAVHTRRCDGASGSSFRVEVHDVVSNDEHAVGLNSVHADRAGSTLEDRNTLVFHVHSPQWPGGRGVAVLGRQYAADGFFG